MNTIIEPTEAFPYKPPTADIKQQYKHIFAITKPLSGRLFKSLFDKLFALVMLLISAPILLLLKILQTQQKAQKFNSLILVLDQIH